MQCSTCGTIYEPPVAGVPYCPNNNCPMHQAGGSAATPRAAVDAAMKEAAMWTQAVKDAEAHLTDVRSKAAAAHADVIAKLEAAKQAAAAEAQAIADAAAAFPDA